MVSVDPLDSSDGIAIQYVCQSILAFFLILSINTMKYDVSISFPSINSYVPVRD